MKIKESRGRKIFKVFNYTFLALLGIATFYPFWYVLIASFNTGRDFMRGGVWIWPRAFTLENYQMAFEDPTIGTSLLISVSATILSIVLGLIVTALAAYALSIKTLPGRSLMNFFWYFTTIFGGGMVPYYMVLRDLKLTSSFWLYVIPGLYSFYNFVLLRSNFATIPGELRESAQLDGAGYSTIFLKIYSPLCKPVYATVALFVAVGQWNSWFDAMLYNRMSSNLTTLQYELMKLLSSVTNQGTSAEAMKNAAGTVTPTSVRAAATIITMLPIICIYPFLQKYFVAGLTLGGVKE